MCMNGKIGANTVKPGNVMITHAMRGSSLQKWGIGLYYNSRIESLKTIWKNYERIYLHLSGFYEGNGYFEMKDGREVTVAGVSDGLNFNILTTQATGIVKPFHSRQPVILADWRMWLINGSAATLPNSYLKLAV